MLLTFEGRPTAVTNGQSEVEVVDALNATTMNRKKNAYYSLDIHSIHNSTSGETDEVATRESIYCSSIYARVPIYIYPIIYNSKFLTMHSG